MSTVAEIEQAALQLPRPELARLVERLADALTGHVGQAPAPRRFSREQIAGWIAEDERDMANFRAGR